MKETQTKERITRNSIEQELWRTNAAEIKGNIFAMSYTLFFGGLISLVLCFAGSQLHFYPVIYVIYIPLALLPMVPFFAILRLHFVVLQERRLLQDGAFDIISTTLFSKDEKYNHIHRELNRYFYFESYPPCEVSYTAYQIASPGDAYYAVLYKTKRPYIKTFYAANMYDFREG